MIEHEHDYDILTGLYNRQAFHRVSEELFRDPHQLGVAALLMMDLDNLSSTSMIPTATTGATSTFTALAAALRRTHPTALWCPAFPAMSSCCCSTAIPVRIRSVRRSAP